MRTTILVVCGVLGATSARAEQFTYSGEPQGPESGFGMGFLIGGGVAGFTDETMRDTVKTRVEGAYDARITLGTRRILGVDIGTAGTFANIDALNGSASGLLYGATIEAAAHVNLLPHEPWTPYGFAGIGWQRYGIRNVNFTLSDAGINSTDHSVVFPVGAGLSYRAPNGFLVDLRGTFRINVNPGLVLEHMGGTDYAPMHAWETSFAVGAEF